MFILIVFKNFEIMIILKLYNFIKHYITIYISRNAYFKINNLFKNGILYNMFFMLLLN